MCDENYDFLFTQGSEFLLFVPISIVKAALYWDAWNRPSPDIGTQLRAQAELSSPVVDPNYQAHLKDFLTKGSADDVSLQSAI